MLWDCRIERLEQKHAVYFVRFKQRFVCLVFTFYSDNAEVVLQDISAAFSPSCHHQPRLHPEQ